MTLSVQYFGMIAECVGAGQNELSFAGSTVIELKTQLESEHPKLKVISYQVAVDQKIATGEQELTENNEIALLPPFAGG